MAENVYKLADCILLFQYDVLLLETRHLKSKAMILSKDGVATLREGESRRVVRVAEGRKEKQDNKC
jgi:hypothetical protein